MPLQMLAVQSRADCANNVLGASTWCAQTIIMGGTSATEIPMTQRPATVIAAIALKYALHEAHLSESEIGFFWMQRRQDRSEEHTSELQSLMRISYAVFCSKKKTMKR